MISKSSRKINRILKSSEILKVQTADIELKTNQLGLFEQYSMILKKIGSIISSGNILLENWSGFLNRILRVNVMSVQQTRKLDMYNKRALRNDA